MPGHSTPHRGSGTMDLIWQFPHWAVNTRYDRNSVNDGKKRLRQSDTQPAFVIMDVESVALNDKAGAADSGLKSKYHLNRKQLETGMIELRRWLTSILFFAIVVGPAFAGMPTDTASKGPLKVFILAGQSNMQGAGVIKMDARKNGGKGSLEYMVRDPRMAGRTRHMVDVDGNWVVRNDVWIWYLDRTGGLTAGFGAKETSIGPEFGFGHCVGEALDQQVLLIKTAWGGKSLAVDFRPPSSGGQVGPFYTEMLEHVNSVLSDIKAPFPAYDGRGYELVGFGWHQGWNDRVNQAHNDAYEGNMVNFIHDVRKELGVKDLPFVIAETGMSGHEEKHPRALSLMRAQAAAAERAEFKGNVAFVGTKDFYRPKEESPSGQSYHWNSNAETYFLIGDGMAKAMLTLLTDGAK